MAASTCNIIKEEKYPLDYANVLADGGDLRFYVSRQWVVEETIVRCMWESSQWRYSCSCFWWAVAGIPSGGGTSGGIPHKSLRGISQDLTQQELIKKLTRDEIGELTDALNGLLGRIREYQSELVRLANTDGLTGILNRRTFFAKGEALLSRHERNVYFVQIDLDHFKSVNDNYGHGIGDQVLELVGRLLQGSVRTVGEREPDIVGRLGGKIWHFAVHGES